MNPKLIQMCDPCGDIPSLRTVQIDCATGQPITPPGTDCVTPAWVKSCDPVPGADCVTPAWVKPCDPLPGSDCNTPAWVKSCDPPQPDCSLGLAMNPITLEVVAVVVCVSNGVPSFTQYNLDGTPYTGPQPVAIDKEWAFQTHTMCDNGAQTVTRTDVFIDGAQVPAYVIWQDMAGNVIAAPNVATLSYGACQVKRLVGVLAGHVCSGGGVPAGFVGYDFDIPTQYPMSTDANDLWLHLIYYIPSSLLYWVPPATTSPTTPAAATDPAIQSYIDAALASFGLTPGDVLWQVNADNTITVWYAPTFNPVDFSFWAGPSTPDGYTGKDTPQIPTTHAATVGAGCTTCTEVQIEKYQAADGTVTEELYAVGTRNLVVLNPGDVLAFGACPVVEASPVPVADGYLLSVGAGGTVLQAFTLPVSSVAVQNMSNNILSIIFAAPVGGNQTHFVAPGGTASVSFDPGVLIPSVTINNLGGLTADVIVNGIRPG